MELDFREHKQTANGSNNWSKGKFIRIIIPETD